MGRNISWSQCTTHRVPWVLTAINRIDLVAIILYIRGSSRTFAGNLLELMLLALIGITLNRDVVMALNAEAMSIRVRLVSFLELEENCYCHVVAMISITILS